MYRPLRYEQALSLLSTLSSTTVDKLSVSSPNTQSNAQVGRILGPKTTFQTQHPVQKPSPAWVMGDPEQTGLLRGSSRLWITSARPRQKTSLGGDETGL
jgi:hypothetical protein